MSKLSRFLLVMLLVGTVAACEKKVEGEASDETTTETASADTKLTDAIIKKYIMENPQVIMESVQKYQRKNNAAPDDKKAEADIKANRAKIFNDPNSPIYGNPKGKIEIVEFFDYNCGYCKRMIPDIIKLVSENKEVKFIFKELPILGPTSETAALAALVVHDIQPKKYFEFHTKMMEHQGQKDDAAIMEVAQSVGIDGKKVVTKMKEEKYKEMLAHNVEIAQLLSIRGTPSLIINGKLFRGAIGYEAMKNAATAPAQPAKK